MKVARKSRFAPVLWLVPFITSRWVTQFVGTSDCHNSAPFLEGADGRCVSSAPSATRGYAIALSTMVLNRVDYCRYDRTDVFSFGGSGNTVWLTVCIIAPRYCNVRIIKVLLDMCDPFEP